MERLEGDYDHSPINLLETALSNLAFIAKLKGLEDSIPFRMAMTQIDLAREKLLDRKS